MTITDFRSHCSRITAYLQSMDDYTLAVVTATAKDSKMKFNNKCDCICGIAGGGTVAGYYGQSSNIAKAAEHSMALLAGISRRYYFAAADRVRNHVIAWLGMAEQKRREETRAVGSFPAQHATNLKLFPVTPLFS
jgi:hypothetical protein